MTKQENGVLGLRFIQYSFARVLFRKDKIPSNGYGGLRYDGLRI